MNRVFRLLTCVVLVICAAASLTAPLSGDIQSQGATPGSDQVDTGPPEIAEQSAFDQNEDSRHDGIRYAGEWMTDVDSLTVYSSTISDPEASPATFLDNATWLIDAGDDGTTELIIVFSAGQEGSTALIWDDQNRDGSVGWRPDGEGVAITESDYPSMTVGADGEWFRPDGSMNLNVWSTLDGCGPCNRTADGKVYVDDLRRRFVIDGEPDWIARVVDHGDDGSPELYELRMLTDVPESLYGVARAGVASNEGGSRPDPPANFLFWPLLPVEPFLGEINYFDRPPVIGIDWDDPIVDLIELEGYPIEVGFHVNSYAYSPDPMAVMEANFENPMPYYDLANDKDGYPEMHVRFEYFRPQDTPFRVPPRDHGLDSIQYSWNQANNPGLGFDFKVDLAGRYSVDSVYDAAGTKIRMVPYPDIPKWVVDREWDVRTFVAVMTPGGYRSSEGIYAWDTPEFYPYIEGLVPTAPRDQLLDVGYRAEKTVKPGSALLFIDPVDGLLHLAGFETGYWQITGERELHYFPASDATGVGEWQLRDGSIVSRLVRVPGGLIYSDHSGTWFKQVDLPESTETFLPPSDHETWKSVGERLRSESRAFEPDDLRAMFDQFPADAQMISTEIVSNSMPTGDSYALLADATSDSVRASIAALTGAEPGSEQVWMSLVDGQWSAQGISYSPLAVTIEAAPEDPFQTTQLEVRITNDSPLEYRNVTVSFTADSVDGGEQTVQIISPWEERTLRFDWPPLASGAKAINVLLTSVLTSSRSTESEGEVILAQAEAQIIVPDAPNLTPSAAADMGWLGNLLDRFAAAAGLVVVAATLGLLTLRGRLRAR